MSNYIYERVEKLTKKYKTRDPFELLHCLNVVVFETDKCHDLKGYCLMSCQTVYVTISSFLSESEKRIVAAHELGHVVLHRRQLKLAPMKDSMLYDMTSSTEYKANLFAADLMLADADIEVMSRDEEMDYFNMCRNLCTSPDLMSFKLFSLIKEGIPTICP